MPFIPHTQNDVDSMLTAIGANSIETLFDEIPAALRAAPLQIDDGVSEMAMLARLSELASRDDDVVCFAGAGCYDHHIPSAVWDLTARGEFLTAYTPYQAEASQGTLQLIYEFQSMMTALTGMDVSNASVYDGASAVGEAALMALRSNKAAKSRRVLVAGTVHPHYLEAARNLVRNQGVQLETLPISEHGVTRAPDVAGDFAALVIAQPNFFGQLEDVHALTDWAHSQGALVIAVVNPLSLSVLAPPGQWGETGADVVCGDGQPLGIPMASGGPSFGFLCTRMKFVRQMPGRIIGRTVDTDGKTGFALTLQAREQHIRRGKATSNICTNQGLLVTAATIHMSIVGAEGLAEVARACHGNTQRLADRLCQIEGVSKRYSGPGFHEQVLQLPVVASDVVERLARERILGGVSLAPYFAATDSSFENALLVCATEKRTAAEIERFAVTLERVLQEAAGERT
ncbi:MAG: aminomethyl-transferring glycine dehydrogenase subunit GcvPA [Pseudomonadaceae bacterium]|nr:aminomethyl-transferring glycine dehydrogenase subunit GcvPA [Pseudomonadaceae bacterium]